MAPRKRPSDDKLTEGTDLSITPEGASEESSPEAPKPPEEPPKATDEKKEAEEPKGPLKLSPEAWAKRLGKLGKDPGIEINGVPVPPAFSWDHAAADQVHGWSKHSLHSAEPLELELADYEAALQAAHKTDAKGNYTPHSRALSPFRKG